MVAVFGSSLPASAASPAPFSAPSAPWRQAPRAPSSSSQAPSALAAGSARQRPRESSTCFWKPCKPCESIPASKVLPSHVGLAGRCLSVCRRPCLLTARLLPLGGCSLGCCKRPHVKACTTRGGANGGPGGLVPPEDLALSGAFAGTAFAAAFEGAAFAAAFEGADLVGFGGLAWEQRRASWVLTFD